MTKPHFHFVIHFARLNKDTYTYNNLCDGREPSPGWSWARPDKIDLLEQAKDYSERWTAERYYACSRCIEIQPLIDLKETEL